MTTLEDTAIAEQVQDMRDVALVLERAAWPKNGSADNVFGLFWQAAKLRANADRLLARQRAREAGNG